MKGIKVTFEDDCREFSTWTLEKIENALRNLCWLINESPEIINQSSFCSSLDYTLELYALFNCDLHTISSECVYKLLKEYNIEGFYFLKDLINGTEKSKFITLIKQSIRDEQILCLIEENNKLNRTLLAEPLEQSYPKDEWLKSVIDDLEYVHHGEKTWEWFYNIHSEDRSQYQPRITDPLIMEVYDLLKSN